MYESNLPDWYRTAGLQPEAENIPKRIVAIKNFDADANQVVSLAQLFYGVGDPSVDFLSTLRAKFREQDSVFSNQGNEAELAVLAGAKLVQLMYARSFETSEMATLAVACAACQGLQKNPPVPQITEIAFKRLAEQSRDRAQVFAERLNSTQSTGPDGAAGLDIGKEFAKMQSDIRVVMEESNMLWWLFAQHSRDENRRWVDMDFPASVVKIGKELADLTEILPGPPSAAAFLDRVCRLAKNQLPDKIGFKAAIDGLATDWKKSYCERSYIQELEFLTPLSNAIRLSLLTSGNGNWMSVFSGSTKIDPESVLSPQKLCLQMFLEGLLVRAWRQCV